MEKLHDSFRLSKSSKHSNASFFFFLFGTCTWGTCTKSSFFSLSLLPTFLIVGLQYQTDVILCQFHPFCIVLANVNYFSSVNKLEIRSSFSMEGALRCGIG